MSEQLLDTSRIIFMGGAPRSGTTLVQRILASHSLVYGGPEFDLMPDIVNLRNVFHGSVENGRINKYLSHTEVDNLFAKFVALAFSYKLSKLEGKRYISEKTPANVTVFPELAEIFPNSHLVLVLRDPRAVVASMLQVGKRYRKEGKRGPPFTMSVRGAVEYINECWAAGNEVIGKHRNVHVVYYEDIVKAPKETVGKLVAGLGIQFEPKMVEMKEYDMPEFRTGEEYWYSKEKLHAPITHDSVGAWREQLTMYQDYFICKRIHRIEAIERYDLKAENKLQNRIFEIIDNLGWGIRNSIRRAVRKVGGFIYRGLV